MVGEQKHWESVSRKDRKSLLSDRYSKRLPYHECRHSRPSPIRCTTINSLSHVISSLTHEKRTTERTAIAIIILILFIIFIILLLSEIKNNQRKILQVHIQINVLSFTPIFYAYRQYLNTYFSYACRYLIYVVPTDLRKRLCCRTTCAVNLCYAFNYFPGYSGDVRRPFGTLAILIDSRSE